MRACFVVGPCAPTCVCVRVDVCACACAFVRNGFLSVCRARRWNGGRLAGAGGFLQQLVFGASGMRIQREGLFFDPPAPVGAPNGACCGQWRRDFRALGDELSRCQALTHGGGLAMCVCVWACVGVCMCVFRLGTRHYCRQSGKSEWRAMRLSTRNTPKHAHTIRSCKVGRLSSGCFCFQALTIRAPTASCVCVAVVAL